MTRRVNKRRQAGLGGRPTASLDDLRAELASIRERGHSISRGEYVAGIGTVAVAVRSSSGEPVAALSIDFLVAPETERLLEQLPVELTHIADEIERAVQSG
jgi:DNA-binding IclR family transcriptional regulator